MSITPKHWDEFQHYKDRSPIWIKLHRKLLDDFAFHRLPVASKALAPLLWLLASEYEGGKITATTEEIAYRMRMTEGELVDALKPLIESGFFESASKTLARRKRVAMPEKRREETERETQVRDREETDSGAVADATPPDAGKIFDEQFWSAYPRREGANPKAPARKAFITAVKNDADPDAIVSGALRYAADLSKSNKVGTSYVAQALTWLNQKRWEDYPDAVVSTSDPPKPPDPRLPSHDELKRRYAVQNADDGRAQEEGKGLRPDGPSARVKARSEGQAEPPDDQAGHGRMEGVGTLFHRTPGLSAVGDAARLEAPLDGRDRCSDDGADAVAGVVRH